MKRLALAFLCCTALSGPAWAVETPRPQRDPNMRTQAYRPDTRFLIIGTLRRSTTITFGSDESVVRVIFGDDEIWDGPEPAALGNAPLRNHLPLWPKKVGRTNLQVITSAPGRPDRLYQFATIVRDAPADGSDDPEATYGLTFTYPGQVSPQRAAELRERQQQAEGREAARRLLSDPYGQAVIGATFGRIGINMRYVARGDREISPVTIEDNGVETHLIFHPAFPVPAVFILGRDGSERAVMMERRTTHFVLPGVHELLRLRHGNQVLDIHNVGFRRSISGPEPWRTDQRGTTTEGVTRELRRGQPR